MTNTESLHELVHIHRLVIEQAIQQLQDGLRNHAASVASIEPSDTDYAYYAAVVSNDIHDLKGQVESILSTWDGSK